MWVSKKKFKRLEDEVLRLKEKTSDLDESTQDLKHGLLVKICQNSVMKEQYNFELLKYLYEQLGIEKPKLECDFVRQKPSTDNNR